MKYNSQGLNSLERIRYFNHTLTYDKDFLFVRDELRVLKELMVQLSVKVYVNKDGRKMLSAMGQDIVDYTNLPYRFTLLKRVLDKEGL